MFNQTLDDFAAPPLSLVSGVVATAKRQVEEVERVVRRYHHARAATLRLPGFDGPKRYPVLGLRLDRELVIGYER